MIMNKCKTCDGTGKVFDWFGFMISISAPFLWALGIVSCECLCPECDGRGKQK